MAIAVSLQDVYESRATGIRKALLDLQTTSLSTESVWASGRRDLRRPDVRAYCEQSAVVGNVDRHKSGAEVLCGFRARFGKRTTRPLQLRIGPVRRFSGPKPIR